MIIAVFFIFLYVAVIIFKNIKNYYSWFLFLMMLSFNIIIISLVLYIYKLTDYRSLIQLDNALYYYIVRLKVSFFDIFDIMNVGVTIFIFGKLSILFMEYRKKAFPRMCMIFAAAAVCILYCYINMFKFIQGIHTGHGRLFGLRDDRLLTAACIYNYSLIIISGIIPYLRLLYSYRYTRITYRKKQYRMLMIVLAIIDIFFYGMFIIGPFRGMVFNKTDLIGYMNIRPFEYGPAFYTYFPVIVLLMLNVITIILIKYHILDTISIFKRRQIIKDVSYMPQDIRHMMHSYKNAFFSINTIAQKIERLGDEDKEESAALLREIKNISDEYVRRSSDVSNISHEVISNLTVVSVGEILKKATAGAVYDGIELNVDIPKDDFYVFGDEDQLIEVIKNMLNNSAEAIMAAKRDKGRIDISILHDDEWVCIRIWDNGKGIEQKDKKRIFKPLFTTKKTNKNWGIGLSYANKIINSHLGMILVDSRAGVYSEFQILLPKSKENVVLYTTEQ